MFVMKRASSSNTPDLHSGSARHRRELVAGCTVGGPYGGGGRQPYARLPAIQRGPRTTWRGGRRRATSTITHIWDRKTGAETFRSPSARHPILLVAARLSVCSVTAEAGREFDKLATDLTARRDFPHPGGELGSSLSRTPEAPVNYVS